MPNPFMPNNTTKSNEPNPPGIKLMRPDNAAMIKMPIKVGNAIWIPTIYAAKYSTNAATNHSTADTIVQYTPRYFSLC